MATPAIPAGLPPRVFTALTCTATRLIRGAVGFDEVHDWWHVPNDSPILESFSTIAKIDGLAGSPPQYLVEGAVLLRITLPPCSLAATPLVLGVSVGRGTLEVGVSPHFFSGHGKFLTDFFRFLADFFSKHGKFSQSMANFSSDF